MLPLVTVSYRLPPAILLPAYAANMANGIVLQADRVEKTETNGNQRISVGLTALDFIVWMTTRSRLWWTRHGNTIARECGEYGKRHGAARETELNNGNQRISAGLIGAWYPARQAVLRANYVGPV